MRNLSHFAQFKEILQELYGFYRQDIKNPKRQDSRKFIEKQFDVILF